MNITVTITFGVRCAQNSSKYTILNVKIRKKFFLGRHSPLPDPNPTGYPLP